MTSWGRVWAITLAGVIAAFQIGKLPVSLLALRAELGLGLVFTGWVVSAVFVVGLLFGILGGRIADQIGHRRVIILSLLCTGLASGGGAFAHSGAAILASRIIEGVGVTFILVTASTLVVRYTAPADRSLALGVFGMWMPVGAGVMILLSPPILAHFGWRGVWTTNAVILLAYAAVIAYVTRDPAPARQARDPAAAMPFWRGVRITATTKGPLLLTISSGIAAAGSIAISSFLPTFFIEESGLSLERAGILTGIVVLAGGLGNVTSGWLMGRGARIWLVIAASSIGLGVAGFCVFAADLSFAARYVLCGVYFICVALVFSALWSAVPVIMSSSGLATLLATAQGFRQQGISVGMLLGPPTVAAIATVYSWREVSWFVLGLSVAGVMTALCLRPLERAAAAQAAAAE